MIPKELSETAATLLKEAIAEQHFGEIAHWVAAPMKDVGTFEQFHDVVDRAEAALTAALSSQWRGMESAPKDGTDFLAVLPPEETGEGWEFHVLFYEANPRHPPSCWWTYDGGRFERFTHWMPLPPPPATQE